MPDNARRYLDELLTEVTDAIERENAALSDARRAVRRAKAWCVVAAVAALASAILAWTVR